MCSRFPGARVRSAPRLTGQEGNLSSTILLYTECRKAHADERPGTGRALRVPASVSNGVGQSWMGVFGP